MTTINVLCVLLHGKHGYGRSIDTAQTRLDEVKGERLKTLIASIFVFGREDIMFYNIFSFGSDI